MHEKAGKRNNLDARILFGLALGGVAFIIFGTNPAGRPKPPAPEKTHQDVPVVDRRLLDLPFEDRRLTPQSLPSSVQRVLGRRVRLSGYVTPSTPEDFATMATVFLRRRLEIPGDGRELMRDYVVVDLRRPGAFNWRPIAQSTFEGVFQLRDVSRDGDIMYTLYWLTDAVEVPDQ